MPSSTIQFTQAQARDLVNVSPGDLRQWRKSVPYLATKPGKAARFTFGDLVGLALTRELITTFGVRISTIGCSVDALFRALADVTGGQLRGAWAVLGADGAKLLRRTELADQLPERPLLVLPCDPLIGRIAHQVLPPGLPAQQPQLPFPPHVVRGGA